jgi:trehalose/maltose transport system permease protein
MGPRPFQTFYLILLPLTAPALVTTGLLAFINAWNEYLFALTFTTIEPDARTVPVAIALFTGQISRQEPFGEIMAAAVVVTLPLLVLVVFRPAQDCGRPDGRCGQRVKVSEVFTPIA